MDDQPHRMFGPYRILDQIGLGGMGAVYRALDTRLQREVAVKVLHRHVEVSDARERFLREARAVSSLNHPNICTVFDIGEEGDEPFLVMELLKGESLKERIARAPFTDVEIREIALQSAAALEVAHAQGIVHRDIKPANLFLVAAPNGQMHVKVLDFGLAKLETDRLLHTSDLTRFGSIVGTVEYMSPEQARGLELDPRSDLFSLGAVLYEMATGEVPFRGATSAVVFAELLGNDPIPPRTSNTRLSSEMDAIIWRLLRKDLDERIQSATELIRLLRQGESRAMSSTEPGPAAVPLDRKKPVSAAIPARSSRPSNAIEITDPDTPSHRNRFDVSRTSRFRVIEDPDDPDDAEPWPQAGAEPEPPQTDSDPHTPADHSRVPLVFGMLAIPLVLVFGIAYLLLHHGGASGGQVPSNGPLQIMELENGTGDATLTGVSSTALYILLQESPTLQIIGPSVAGNGASTNPVSAKAVAQVNHAVAYLTGAVDRDGSQYRIHTEIRDTADDQILASEEVEAQSRVKIPQALERLSVALRTHMGQTAEEANASTVPLATEASASIPALEDFTGGIALAHAGALQDAVEQLQRAIAEDPNFPLARLELAEVFGELAETQAAASVLAPLAHSHGVASACQQYRVTYALSQPAPDVKLAAAQKWASACPHHPAAAMAIWREMFRSGRFAEAETAAARAVALEPDSREAYRADTLALIAGNHFEAAVKQQQHASRSHIASPGALLASAYLLGNEQIEQSAVAAVKQSPDWRDQVQFVSYLGNRGEIAHAAEVGNAAAALADRTVQGSMAGAALRTQVAAMEAMSGHCRDADLATDIPQASDRVRMYLAIAGAWCHRQTHLQGFEDGGMAALAAGAAAWSSGDAPHAISLLHGISVGPPSMVASTLRGEADLTMGHPVTAMDEFQSVLTHRGAAYLSGTIAYPVAEAGLATAYRTMGDTANATLVQGQLQALWSHADPDQPLLRKHL